VAQAVAEHHRVVAAGIRSGLRHAVAPRLVGQLPVGLHGWGLRYL